MTRIAIPPVAEATGATADLYAGIRKAVGGLPNAYAALGHLAPAGLKAMLGADAALAAGTLSKQDIEVIKLVVSELAGCDYCVAAHSQVGKLRGLSAETMRQVRAGEATGDGRRDALVRFVRTLHLSQGTIDAAEFDAVKAAGYTDAQLAEVALAIAVITFTNVFNRINDTAIDFPAVD